MIIPIKRARVIRFVEPGVLPHKMAAQYDKAQNLMLVDKWLYDRLNTYYQNQVLFADNDVIVET
jgi:hypothetical protein